MKLSLLVSCSLAGLSQNLLRLLASRSLLPLAHAVMRSTVSADHHAVKRERERGMGIH